MHIEGNYTVRRDLDHDLTPEDTLADGQSGHSSVERPIGPFVFIFVYVLFALLLGGYLYQSADLQIVNGAGFASIVNQRSHQTITLPPVRGIIYDSAGKRIAENEAVLDVIVQTNDFISSKNDKQAVIAQIAHTLLLPTEDLAKVFDDNRKLSSFIIKSNISKEEALLVQNQDWPGVYVIPDIRRRYNFGSAFAHIIGHMSKILPEEMSMDPFYLINDRIGRSGIEGEYEQSMRGEHIRLPLSRESWTAIGEPKTGDDVHLTIDIAVQQKLADTLSRVLHSAGLSKGAAVVQNVRTGEVLAMVSAPTFDPNLFEETNNESEKQELSLLLSNRLQPIFNRAIGGRYAPGSTIKPLYAMAGLQEGVITPTTSIYSAGQISVVSEANPNTTFVFHDWKIHGATDLKKAIAQSVDVYFYALGGGYGNIKGLGVERLSQYLKLMNADKTTGIDLPEEKSGVVPDREWKQQVKHEPWYVGDTYNMSIGQGNLLVTPLWLNVYTSVIANGGKIYRPYIVSRIQNTDTIVKQTQPMLIGTAPFSDNVIKTVQEAMRATVTEGTAKLLNDLPVRVAAKTGTAQIAYGDTNSLITVWGPYENPDIAMTVVIEGTKEKYGLVHQVAHDFLLWYFTTVTTQK